MSTWIHFEHEKTGVDKWNDVNDSVDGDVQLYTIFCLCKIMSKIYTDSARKRM